MWKYGGWESEFKLGVVTPHADVCPEAETQAMLMGTLSTIHGARVDFSPMHPGGTIDNKIAHAPVLQFVAPEVIDRTVESLSSSPLDAIGLAFTSSSFMIGVEYEREVLDRLSGVSRGIKLNTTGTAATAAMQRLELKKIAVMAPSWFDDELCHAGHAYFRDQGLDIISVTSSGPVGGPLGITPATTAEAVAKLVRDTGAQAVFIAGNGQRAIGAIDYLERKLGITVLTANQVLLWASLEDSDMKYQVTGYGHLFTNG